MYRIAPQPEWHLKYQSLAVSVDRLKLYHAPLDTPQVIPTQHHQLLLPGDEDATSTGQDFHPDPPDDPDCPVALPPGPAPPGPPPPLGPSHGGGGGGGGAGGGGPGGGGGGGPRAPVPVLPPGPPHQYRKLNLLLSLHYKLHLHLRYHSKSDRPFLDLPKLLALMQRHCALHRHNQKDTEPLSPQQGPGHQ